MPWALSISEKKKCFSGCHLPSSLHHFLQKKTWHDKFSLSGCHLLSYFHHSVGERVTWLIQLIWISFAFIFSPFFWEKSDMADSAYLAVHLSSSFHHFCGRKSDAAVSAFLAGICYHFFTICGRKKKQTWQIRVGCSDSKYMLLAYFFLGI